MNRNTESHFSLTPTIGISRSKFDRSHTHKGTCNTGEIVPIFCTDILPGDTVKMNMSQVIRMMTPITPVMDNAFADIYFFFTPNRLVYEHWKEEMGENDTAPWIQNIEYTTPQIIAPDGGWTKGSLADHFGWPTKVGGYKADAMPFRQYALIYNEWFRDENLKNPLYIHTGDADIQGVDILDAALDPITDIEKGACCAKASKVHDYFTSCLPGMQKGTSVKIPIGTTAQIVGSDNIYASGQSLDTNLVGEPISIQSRYLGGSDYVTDVMSAATGSNLSDSQIGLVADLSNAVGATITQLRQAFQIQKFYEKAALSGSRYIETIKGHFDVTNPDFRMQRPEYLGGTRIPININQVVQTDATSQRLGGSYNEDEEWVWNMTDQTPQGNTAAYSLTTGKEDDLFTHSFTEHGYLMGLMVIRTVHTYQQGLNRMFSRKSIFDYYWPEFANLSNQSVLNKEIYLQGPSVVDPDDGKVVDEKVFGYQECWAEYRYHPDQITGELRSNYDQSLDIWHYGDDYNALPQLGSDWIDETDVNVARTLAVQNHDQFMFDLYFKCIMTRPMPLYSVPGLIDHH